jgi:NADPH-dependent 2,4-dienoyl-CoA reductase/sulfur reductase-like enzyme
LGKAARESLFLVDRKFFAEHKIGEVLGRRAVALDADSHDLKTDDGYDIGYEKLLIATGCCLRELTCAGADLPGLYYVRTLPQVEKLRQAALGGKQVVIIGAGFIGLEVASVLAQMGLGVTVIHRGNRLFDKFGVEEISTFFDELFAAHGVHTIYGDQAAELGGEGRVEAVSTQSGRLLPCDFAVAGIGVRPDTEYLNGSGLEIENGVVVDAHLRTRYPDVYAAGDIANFHDAVYGRHRRIEHWDNAIRQGRLAAVNMAGAEETFHHTSFFYSKVFDVTLEVLGDMSDYDQVVTKGSFEDRSVTVFYLKEGILQAAFLMGRPPHERKNIDSLISQRRQLESVS